MALQWIWVVSVWRWPNATLNQNVTINESDKRTKVESKEENYFNVRNTFIVFDYCQHMQFTLLWSWCVETELYIFYSDCYCLELCVCRCVGRSIDFISVCVYVFGRLVCGRFGLLRAPKLFVIDFISLSTFCPILTQSLRI